VQQVGRFQDLDLAAHQLGPMQVKIVSDLFRKLFSSQ
jgi:hypothetical protein